MTLPQQQSNQPQSQHFLLKWNNHRSNMVNVFESLLQAENLVDVTIGVEGRFLKAHKIVLSACSPYFQAMFVNQTPSEKYPILIFHDMKFTHLKILLDFMYRGEISIDEKDLGEVLKIAEALSIRGLSSFENDDEESEKSEPSQNQSQQAGSGTPGGVVNGSQSNPPPQHQQSSHVESQNLGNESSTNASTSTSNSHSSKGNASASSPSKSGKNSSSHSKSSANNSSSKSNGVKHEEVSRGKGHLGDNQGSTFNHEKHERDHSKGTPSPLHVKEKSSKKNTTKFMETQTASAIIGGGTATALHVPKKRGRKPKIKTLPLVHSPVQSSKALGSPLPKLPSPSRFAELKNPLQRQGVRRRIPRRYPGVPTRLKRVKLAKRDEEAEEETGMDYEEGPDSILTDIIGGPDCEPLSEMSVRGLDLFKYASIEDGVYRCIECEKLRIPKTFKNKYSFQRHAFLYHEGNMRKVFPCPVCSREFSRPDKMKNHLRSIHEGASSSNGKDPSTSGSESPILINPKNESMISCDG